MGVGIEVPDDVVGRRGGANRSVNIAVHGLKGGGGVWFGCACVVDGHSGELGGCAGIATSADRGLKRLEKGGEGAWVEMGKA